MRDEDRPQLRNGEAAEVKSRLEIIEFVVFGHDSGGLRSARCGRNHSKTLETDFAQPHSTRIEEEKEQQQWRMMDYFFTSG